jgi:hypothetical protein
MSALMREAFENASPRDVFALDSSTTASRDRYLHLGFEVIHSTVPISIIDLMSHCRSQKL